MKKQTIFTIVIALIFLSTASAYSAAQLGVKTGDWIKLTVTITNPPSGMPIPTWMKIEFLTVTATTATIRLTTHMLNGTELNETSTYDLASGITTGGTNSLTGLVIPTGSNVGDRIYIISYGNITIAGETTRSYAGASRVVLYANFSAYGNQQTYYWDKQTGVIVEISATSASTTGSGKVTETNMWRPQFLGLPIDETTFYALVALIAVILVAGAVLAVRRKKKPKPSEQTITTPSTVPQG